MNEKLDKIKKLLALSKSPNEHEAALALSKAMEMAAEEGVDLDGINLNDDEILSQEYSIEPQSKKIERWKSYLWVRISRLFGCAILQNTYCNSDFNRRYRIKIAGRKSDIEIADYVGCYLQRELLRLCRKEIASVRKGRKLAHSKLRESFLMGAAQRVTQMAEMLYREGAQNGISTRFDLVLSKAGRAKAWIDNLPDLTPLKYTDKIDAKAFNSGFSRAGNITLNKAVSGSDGIRKRIGG